jgi:hypothetical protein
VQTLETGRCAVLHPAIGEAARRADASAVGLVDVGCSAGLNLHVDRIGIAYSDGRAVGDPTSAVQVSVTVRGCRPVPTRALPEVVARVRVDRARIDVTDPDDVRWLRACLPPDAPQRSAELEAALAVAACEPALLLQGDAVDVLPEALARVPAGALPVVTTTWALSRLPPAGRRRLLEALHDGAAERPVAWVSAEGVGVAPEVPTLGDRPASGHSLVGVALFDRSTRRVDAVGRCWSRGSRLEWLADS